MSLLKTSYSRSSTESIEPSVLLHFNGGNGPIDVVNEVGDVDYNSSKHRGTAGFGDNGRYTKLNTSVKKMGNSALDMSMNESFHVYEIKNMMGIGAGDFTISNWMRFSAAPYIINPTAILHFDGPNNGTTFTEERGKTFTVYNSAHLDANQKMVGLSSGYFGNDDDYISTPYHSDWSPGIYSFALSFWVRFLTQPTNPGAIIASQYQDSENYWYIAVDASKIRFVAYRKGSERVNFSLDYVPSLGVWNHICLCRYRNYVGSYEYMKIFINGTDPGGTANLTASDKYVGCDSGSFFIGAKSYSLKTNAVPEMTSDVDPSPFVCTESSYLNSSYRGWKLFSNRRSSSGDAPNDFWQTPNGTTTGWVKLFFGASGGKAITSYAIVATNYGSSNPTLWRGPKTWTLKGSNDDSSWDTLDTQTNVSNWSSNERRVFSFSNTTSYDYYMIEVTANQGASSLVIQALQLYEDPVYSSYFNGWVDDLDYRRNMGFLYGAGGGNFTPSRLGSYTYYEVINFVDAGISWPSNGGFIICTQNNRIAFVATSDGSDWDIVLTSENDFNLNEWFLVTVMSKGGTISLLIDGEERSSVASSVYTQSSNSYYCHVYFNQNTVSSGHIYSDEFVVFSGNAIYDIPFTPSENELIPYQQMRRLFADKPSRSMMANLEFARHSRGMIANMAFRKPSRSSIFTMVPPLLKSAHSRSSFTNVKQWQYSRAMFKNLFVEKPTVFQTGNPIIVVKRYSRSSVYSGINKEFSTELCIGQTIKKTCISRASFKYHFGVRKCYSRSSVLDTYIDYIIHQLLPEDPEAPIPPKPQVPPHGYIPSPPIPPNPPGAPETPVKAGEIPIVGVSLSSLASGWTGEITTSFTYTKNFNGSIQWSAAIPVKASINFPENATCTMTFNIAGSIWNSPPLVGSVRSIEEGIGVGQMTTVSGTDKTSFMLSKTIVDKPTFTNKTADKVLRESLPDFTIVSPPTHVIPEVSAYKGKALDFMANILKSGGKGYFIGPAGEIICVGLMDLHGVGMGNTFVKKVSEGYNASDKLTRIEIIKQSPVQTRYEFIWTETGFKTDVKFNIPMSSVQAFDESLVGYLDLLFWFDSEEQNTAGLVGKTIFHPDEHDEEKYPPTNSNKPIKAATLVVYPPKKSLVPGQKIYAKLVVEGTPFGKIAGIDDSFKVTYNTGEQPEMLSDDWVDGTLMPNKEHAESIKKALLFDKIKKYHTMKLETTDIIPFPEPAGPMSFPGYPFGGGANSCRIETVNISSSGTTVDGCFIPSNWA